MQQQKHAKIPFLNRWYDNLIATSCFPDFKRIWIIIDTLKNLIFFWIFSNWQPGTKSQQKHMTPLVDARVLYSWKNKSFMRISNLEHNVYIISSTTWIINAYIISNAYQLFDTMLMTILFPYDLNFNKLIHILCKKGNV